MKKLAQKEKLKVTYSPIYFFTGIDLKRICPIYPQGTSAAKDRIKDHVYDHLVLELCNSDVFDLRSPVVSDWNCSNRHGLEVDAVWVCVRLTLWTYLHWSHLIILCRVFSITTYLTNRLFFFLHYRLSFFFLRKISPGLASAANPPLFAEEDWP